MHSDGKGDRSSRSSATLTVHASCDRKAARESTARGGDDSPRPSPAVTIVALLRDRLVQARARHAIGPEGRLLLCRVREDLLIQASHAQASLILTDLWDSVGQPVSPVVRQLSARYPTVPIIAYCTLTPESSREVLEVSRAGVMRLIFAGFDDVENAVRSAVLLARAAHVCGLLERELDGTLSERMRSVLRRCLEHPGEVLTVRQLAEYFGTSRRTLLNHATREALPAPGCLIAWCRLLMAARLLEDPGRSVEQIALSLDFPTATALRNMLRRYTGLRPGEIRARGGLPCVLNQFKQALALRRGLEPHVQGAGRSGLPTRKRHQVARAER